MTTPRTQPVLRRRRIALLAVSQLAIALILGATACTSTNASKEPEDQVSDDSGPSGTLSDAPSDALSNELAKEELGEPSQKQADHGLAIPPEQEPAPPTAQQPNTPPDVSPNVPSGMSSGAQKQKRGDDKFTGNFSEVGIVDIRYVARKGGGTVVVETSAPATYHTREVPSQSQVVIEVANAQLPERLKRPFVTKDFHQSISSINAYQDKGSSTVRVVVQFRSPMHAEVNRDGRELKLTAAEPISEIEDNPTLGTRISNSNKAETSGVESSESISGHGNSQILPEMPADKMATENIKFYGKPISIEVRDAPVRDVINLIADQSGANIVIAGEVDGNISLKLRQVPWDQVLLIVMRTRNLGYVRQGSILRVAPFEALQKESEAAKRVVDARKAAEPLRVKIIPVGYAKVDALEKQIAAFLSLNRGKVVGDQRTNSLVVTDTPDVLERVANLVKALDLPPLQVLIEGKVIEARETFTRNIGVRWGFSGSPVEIGGGRQMTHGFDTNISLPSGGAGYGFRIGQFDIFGDINATIGLAEIEDQVKIVSSPRVVALNNEQATIVQGTNIPTSTTTQTGGVALTSVAYTPIEMKLEVTPQVTSENDVIMQINIKRDFAGARVSGVQPDINKREAKTKVLVRNGQTAVIGGVYQSDLDDTEHGVPWLRNVPVLGWLFKNKSINTEKSELLVFLTPRILNAETSIQKESTL